MPVFCAENLQAAHPKIVSAVVASGVIRCVAGPAMLTSIGCEWLQFCNVLETFAGNDLTLLAQ